MAATDGQITVAAARWAEEGSYLREFVAKHPLPAVVKIIKGQYGGLGVPTLPCPALQSTALLVSAGKRQKIIAQAVKIKEGRRLLCIGSRLIIPDTYFGYFEILSEEGRAVRCIESVAELAKRKPEEGCLVRETIRGIQAKTDSDGSLKTGCARIIAPGEILIPTGDVVLSGQKNRYLKCLDSGGETILLGMEQRGKFSALAREDNISGVHTAKNLLSKRLPLTVRLVHGTTPLGLKNPVHFVPELRLFSMFEEEHVFALPLQKMSQNVIALPLAAPLKLLQTRNEEQLYSMPEFNRLIDKCTKLVAEVCDRMLVLEGKLGESKRCSSTQELKNEHILRRSVSSESSSQRNRHNRSKKSEKKIPMNSKDYDEIDEIYDYIRGFVPLPKSVKSPFSDTPPSVKSQTSSPSPLISSGTKPEPPPIETIPTKNQQVPVKIVKNSETPKDTLSGLPKLFIKNGHSQRNRLLRQKSVSPMKDLPPNSLSKSGSPMFNIRYKSLTNLQAMELDGTLGSSNSGDHVSGDSDIQKHPEKKSKKIPRPKSLTNLVWELKEDSDTSNLKRKDLNAIVYKKHVKQPLTGHCQRETLYL